MKAISSGSCGRLVALVGGLLVSAVVSAAPPVAGPNVNLVSGTKWPQGDPFLTKQNEPSLAISSRNSRHLLAASNDYRLVPVAIAEQLDDPEAWIQIYKSVDGGQTWRSTPLGGCPIDIPECNDSTTGLTAALKARAPNFGADPTVRSGPYGTFFVSHIAGRRDTGANGIVGVQRFVDKDNDVQRVTDVRACPAGRTDCTPVYVSDSCTTPGCPTKASDKKVKPTEDPILPDVYNIIDVGTPGQTKDKPWVAVDVPGRSFNSKQTCTLLGWTKGRTDVADASESGVPAFNVYVSYANFTGGGKYPDIYVARSTDCGQTFAKPVKISQAYKANQGTSSAIDPLTGALYVVWRNFDGPQQILMNKSTDGGASWGWPVVVAKFNPYDQGATGVSFRTLDFPSVAVSVKNGVSRVHVAWTQRKVAPNATPPYACPSGNAADCDARVVVATSTDGGKTWPAAVPITSSTVDTNFNPANPEGRGHQVQAALTFAAGKLLATWLDQRLDHTEGVLQCPNPADQTCAMSARNEVRRAAKNSNLDPNCRFPAGLSPPLTGSCYKPDAVWTTYITDGTPFLVRRHTLDTYAAMADPETLNWGGSSRVSQYTFGNTVQGQLQPPDPNGQVKIKPSPSYYEVVQKEINPPNLPMFSNGQSAFMGDYIDVAGQAIVASGDPAQPYKFNVGAGTNSKFAMGGFAPAFQVAFTDNRDVIAPQSGDWRTPACLTTDFTYDANGNVTGVDTSKGAACQSGYSGNRNQNVYTATLVESSHAYSEANSKALDPSTARGFVVSIRNLNFGRPGQPQGQTYALTLPAQAQGVNVGFDKSQLGNPPNPNTLNVYVQARSTSARTVWATSSTPGAKIVVQVTAPDGYSSQIVLNADPNAPLVKNGDGGSATTDTTADSINSVVLSNAVLTNNALSNNALTNNVLSNNALTNAALSNVVLSNAALSNLDPVNAALSNNVLTNNVLSNVVLSNAVLSNAALSNNVLSNAVLSNVVLSNNAQNAALTNLDPTNAALSNAVLSNNVLTNVVLSNNVLSNNALSNAVLSNNVLTNAALSNVVLSNNALSNNVLSNDSLRYVALSNAPLGDTSQGGDPDALRTIETGSSEIVFSQFTPGDIANTQSPSADFNFKESTFTLRNRGNTDTIVGIKLLLRDAVCSGNTGNPATSYRCTPPTDAGGRPLYKLQLVLRKVALVPVVVPGTTNADIPPGSGISKRSIRVGLAQVNTEVSNVTDVPLVDPSDPTFGKFLQNDPNAALLSLAAGEWVYATVRAIGVNAPDPADLLQWGLKTIAADASNPNGPLVIRTQSFPASPAFVALTPVVTPFQTFGGNGPVTGSAVCSDALGNAVLNGPNDPTSTDGAPGNYFINTSTRALFGPKNPPDAGHPSAWWPPAGTPLIVNGPSGPQASVPCPPGTVAYPSGIGFNPNPFLREAAPNASYSDSNVNFTPKYWGDFYVRASALDSSSPQQADEQVIKVHVDPRLPVLTYTNFPLQLTYQETPYQYRLDLAPLVTSDSKNGATPPIPQPIQFSASGGACQIDADGHTLLIIHASPPNCTVTVSQLGNEIYAPISDSRQIFIDRASQSIVVDSAPATLTYNNFGNVAATLAAHVVTSPATAANSGLAVTFTSQTPGVCTTNNANGADIIIVGAGTCTINADQAGNSNYKPAATVPIAITILPANQTIVFSALPVDHQLTYGNAPTTLVATTTSSTAPAGLTVTFVSLTPGVCTTSGANGQVVTIVGAGTCTIQATQAGNSNYNAAPTLTPSFIVDKANQNLAFGAAPSPTFGDPPVTVSATTSSPTAPPSLVPAIVFASTTPAFCTVGASSMPTATATVPVTIVAAGGPCTITADQAGNANYNAASQAMQTFAIAKAPSQFTVTAQQFTPFGSTPTITGKLNRIGVPAVFPATAPTITLKLDGSPVRVYPPGPPLPPVPAGPDGVVTLSDASIGPETYGVDFSFAGDANFLAATGVSAALRVEGFAGAASMGLARAGHAATLLSDGNVLVAGGVPVIGNNPTNTAEVYCAAAAGYCAPADIGSFKPLAPTMATARYGFTSTLLGDGTVLIGGGAIDNVGIGTPTLNAELYCAVTPATGPCATPTPVNSFVSLAGMGTARAGHAATLLPDGTVLVTGGYDTSTLPVATAEVYCAAASAPGGPCVAADYSFKPTAGAMATARDSHTSTLLPDGTVLIAGGEIDGAGTPTNAAEVYCSAVAGPCAAADGSFKPGANAMSAERSVQTATMLLDGRVFVAGGYDLSGKPTASGDAYCPSALPGFCTGNAIRFAAVGNLATARANQTASLLTDGWALLIGGRNTAGAQLATSELFDPLADASALGASMATARSGHTATRLQDGRVLVTGGSTPPANTVVNSAELYNGPF